MAFDMAMRLARLARSSRAAGSLRRTGPPWDPGEGLHHILEFGLGDLVATDIGDDAACVRLARIAGEGQEEADPAMRAA